jgi:uncharacterized protein YbbK (DUF523 family)
MMNCVLKEKIRIGISECNFGAQVRWNHVGWDRVASLAREKNDYIWVPVCPEILSGFGTPRTPIKLSVGNGDDLWQGKAKVKDRKGKDVSEEMKKGSQAALDIIQRSLVDAFAFMEGSPSCGVYRTTLKDKRLGRPPGVFGSLLLKENLFLIPVLDFDSPWKWWDWSRRLHAFVWLNRENIESKKELYDVWHILKFICQEADRKQADAIGFEIANAPKKLTKDFINTWKREVCELLRRPSTFKRIQAVMVKHYAHYRKVFALSVKEVAAPALEANKHEFIDELKKMERKAFDQGYAFAGHPIAYRPDER